MPFVVKESNPYGSFYYVFGSTWEMSLQQTKKLDQAKRFPVKAEAEALIKNHYNKNCRMSVVEVPGNG